MQAWTLAFFTGVSGGLFTNPDGLLIRMATRTKTYLPCVGVMTLASCNSPFAVTKDICAEDLAARAGKVSIGNQLNVLEVCPTAQSVCVLEEYLSISSYETDPSDTPLKGVDRRCPELTTRAGAGNKLVILHARSCPSIAHLGIVRLRGSTPPDFSPCVSAATHRIVNTKGAFLVSSPFGGT